ncbi:c-type cytochrome [Vannielia litorea]|uniref:c-type cytochrome n=1 Tax=Vannielia litorea TaxID=1217970 RepID=UPI001C98235C|nr:cytochrome c [Vannielia litorea]MBY6048081.1 cytochrome c [Vannielia litorea]MBY6075495.1 cytochrome c [Vannielia litorea]
MKAVLTGAALLMAAGAATAQEVHEGRLLYERHCATCHGLDADGQGPMAPALVLQPVDLTELALTNSGVFPVARVVMRIDGRDPLVSHGSPMPVYAELFAGDDTAVKAETGQPIMTTRAIADLLEYLRTLQK